MAIAREAAMGSEKLVSELQVQLAAAQDVARSQAAETLKLRRPPRRPRRARRARRAPPRREPPLGEHAGRDGQGLQRAQ